MKINRKFNTFTYPEYIHLIENHQRFTDFNTLGLFRAIVESTKLTGEQKIAVRDVAVAAFRKPFEFLQLKDPVTYFELSNLGKTLTAADENQAWEDIRVNQQKIIESKKLNHRNFGTYSKHLCGYETCPLNGLMIRQGSYLADGREMYFCSDSKGFGPWVKAERRRKDRKTEKRIIAEHVESE